MTSRNQKTKWVGQKNEMDGLMKIELMPLAQVLPYARNPRIAVLSALGILLAARRAGRNAERVDALEKQSENVSKSHEVQDKNRRTLADGDAAERLRDDWSRD